MDELFGVPMNTIMLALVAALAFFASLLMTIVPSRRAASIPIAEALRYE